MNKYLEVFKVSFSQEFAYKVNFIMWRVRNVLQIFLVFFLWDAVFANSQKELFGYTRDKILTYVFMLILIRAFIFSAKSHEVAGEIARGEITNLLLKPISYFKYYMTRDIASKVLNIAFAVVESVVLFLLLRPPFFLQTNPVNLLVFLMLILLSALLYFIIVFISGLISFWIPEAAWGTHFFFIVVITTFLSGSYFPLDILPQSLSKIISYTPFPYLIFYPIEVYLGKISGGELVRVLLITGFWLGFLYLLLKYIWKRGLRAYQAYGR